jgi:Fusaric acid resistance protein-like
MTPPLERSNWITSFLHTLLSFDFSRLSKFSGMRIGVFVITPLCIGLILHRLPEAIFATIGTMNISMVEGRRPEWATDAILILVSIIYALVFTIGILFSTIDPLAIPLYALALFIISYTGVYPKAVNIALVCSVVLSIGIGLPGHSISGASESFLLYVIGALWGVLGVTIPLLRSSSKLRATTSSINLHSSTLAYQEMFKPLLSNLSLRSESFRFSISFAITGAIGLLIAVNLGLTKASWVLITICILFLRTEISTTFTLTLMRIIGTIGGAIIGLVITTYVHNQWLLLSFLFILASVYFAVRHVNYTLATLFITSLILVLLNILNSGQTSLPQARVLDTLIGAALALFGQFLVWTGSYWKRQE